MSLPPEPLEDEPRMTGPSPAIRTGWLRALLALVGYLAVLVAIGIVVGFVAVLTADGDPVETLRSLQDRRQIGLGLLAVFQAVNLVGVVSVVVLLRRLVDRASVRSLGLGPAWRDLGAGLAWGTAIIVVAVAVLALGGGVSLVIAAPPIAPSTLLGYLAVLAVVSFQEELLARGYLLANLMDSFPAPLALTLSALVFALLHLGNANVSLLAFLNLVLAGVVLGTYYVHRRNLWFSVGMHLTWNLVQGPILGFEVSGIATPSLLEPALDGPDLLTGGAFGLEGSLVVTVMLVAATAAIHLVYRDNGVRPRS